MIIILMEDEARSNHCHKDVSFPVFVPSADTFNKNTSKGNTKKQQRSQSVEHVEHHQSKGETRLYDAATVDRMVESLTCDFRKMIEDSQAEVNERLSRIEQLLNQALFTNTTPSISLINSTISQNTANKTNFQPPVSSGMTEVGRRSIPYRKKSRSVSKGSYPLEDIRPLSAKELRKKDSILEDSGLITLHFLYKYKKVAIIPFSSETSVLAVREKLNKELQKNHSFSIDKLQISTKRLTEDDVAASDGVCKNDDLLMDLGFQGHQLLYCYGVNKGEQKRARTLNLSSSRPFRPRISVSPASPRKNSACFSDAMGQSLPPSLDIFAARKKKLRSSQGSLETLKEQKKGSPLISTKSNHTENNAHQRNEGDELSELQKLVTDEFNSFDEYRIDDLQ